MCAQKGGSLNPADIIKAIHENSCLYAAEIFMAAKIVALKSVLQKYGAKFFLLINIHTAENVKAIQEDSCLQKFSRQQNL